MNTKWSYGAVWVLVLALAGIVRFSALGRSAVRSDEINFLHYVQRNQSLVELWRNPPWFNQIPLADSVPILWARWTGQAASESVVRQPFAWLGWLTIAFCAAWMIRRRGAGAGLLLGVWLALLPYHVYHSREAYYYVLVMAFSAGMTLRGADFMARVRQGGRLTLRNYAEWTAWTLLACLSHMSVWVVAGMTWLLLGIAGWRGLAGAERRRHVVAMGLVAGALGAGMSRWILRAMYETKRAPASPVGHIGSEFAWVGPRVLPFFAGGANWAGLLLLAAVGAAVAWLLWKDRGRLFRDAPLHGALTALVGFGLAGTYSYIFAVGGGDRAKLTYFAASLPAFLAWAVMSLDRAFKLAGKRQLVLHAGMALLVAVLLAVPAWQITRLDGKPTAYRHIQAELDRVLAPGDIAIVDRWWEPWNEMAQYAPANVFVSFTVPDEPYENYIQFNWRGVTRDLMERNGAQAFIRLRRNHEERLGLWTWPETWFRRRTVVTNAPGLWLRDRGFAPEESFYTYRNRVETEIFYSTRDDIAEKARAAGRPVVWFFDQGWRLYKPWQQGDFHDYRVLEAEAILEVRNLTGLPRRMRLDISATAVGGDAVVRVDGAPPLLFPQGRLDTTSVDVDLSEGVNRLMWRLLSGGTVLFVRELNWTILEPEKPSRLNPDHGI